MNWSKATLKQLVIIVWYEDCPEFLKQLTKKEIKRRLEGIA
jgi:hypothetical protein